MSILSYQYLSLCITFFQASRKHKVPSRTLYDKIKKLGIQTTPRRLATTTTTTKVRQPLTEEPLQDSSRDDRPTMVHHNSGGSLIKAEENSGNLTMDPKLSASRPRSTDLLNEQTGPIDLQVPRGLGHDSLPSVPPHSMENIQQIISQISRSDPRSLKRPHPDDVPQPADLINRSTYSSPALMQLLPPYSSPHIPEELIAHQYNRFQQTLRDEIIAREYANGGEILNTLPQYVDARRDCVQIKAENPQHKSNEDDADLVIDDEPSCGKTTENLAARNAENAGNSIIEDSGTASHSYSTEASNKAADLATLDSPPCYGIGDSGNDSNDVSAASDIETRPQATTGVSVKISSASPLSRLSGNLRPENVSPIVAPPCTGISPVFSEKSTLSIDSDADIRELSKVSPGDSKYKMVSEMGICSQIRPLDLRENSVSMSIPQQRV